MSASLVGGGMLCEKFAETNGFVANIFADKVVAGRGFIAFVEKQVERLQDTVESRWQLRCDRNFERDFGLADFLLRASETLCGRGVRCKKRASDFTDAESAQSFQRERNLIILRNLWMATDEHETQAIVCDFLV